MAKPTRFDAAKDVVLADLGEIQVEDSTTCIQVSINSFNGGEPKLSMVRTLEAPNGEITFLKLGRLTEAEAQELSVVLQSVAEKFASVKSQQAANA